MKILIETNSQCFEKIKLMEKEMIDSRNLVLDYKNIFKEKTIQIKLIEEKYNEEKEEKIRITKELEDNFKELNERQKQNSYYFFIILFLLLSKIFI